MCSCPRQPENTNDQKMGYCVLLTTRNVPMSTDANYNLLKNHFYSSSKGRRPEGRRPEGRRPEGRGNGHLRHADTKLVTEIILGKILPTL